MDFGLRKALCLVLFAVLCIQLCTGMSLKSATIQRRCQCMKYSTRPVPWRYIEEFFITQPHGRCKTTEVVLTLKTINPVTGENNKRCLGLELSQNEILQDCWNRLNSDERRPTLKYSECPQKKTMQMGRAGAE